MPRPKLTPLDRAIEVDRAAGSLAALIARALDVSGTHGYASAQALSAWEAVEANGAIIHRQARLLAGKSKGG